MLYAADKFFLSYCVSWKIFFSSLFLNVFSPAKAFQVDNFFLSVSLFWNRLLQRVRENYMSKIQSLQLVFLLIYSPQKVGSSLPCGTYLFRSVCWAFTGYSSLLGIIWEEKEVRGFFMPYRRIYLFERVSGVDRNILNNAYFW